MRKMILTLLVATSLLSAKLNAQVIFADDFSNSALPNWTITNESSPVSGAIWKWANTGTGTGQYAGTFQGPTFANGYIILDSDADGDQTGTTTRERTVITSKAINCTGAQTVLLSFNEYFAQVTGDTAWVQVSTDSVNWTTVHSPATGLAADQSTANPNGVQVNISAITTGQTTVYVRFTWRGDWGYWWFVDDVKVLVPATQDAVAFGINNTISNGCLLSNAETIQLFFKNAGLTPMDSVVAKYSINNGPAVSEKVMLTPALAYDSQYIYTFTTPLNLSVAGNYGIAAWVELVGDTVHTNDTAFTFAISAAPIDLTTPYTMGFEVPAAGGTEIGAYTWTTEDVNQDLVTWQLSGRAPNSGVVDFEYLFSATAPANDWLFSPCLNMVANTAYRIDFFDRTGVDAQGVYPEKLELKTGTTKTGAGMTYPIVNYGTITDTGAYTERKTAFKPTGSGIYYVGFHAYSAANQWFLNIDDVTIDILPAPNAQFAPTAAGDSVTVVDGSDDVITNWVWHWGDGTNSNGQTPGAHAYAASGTYNVCLTVTNLAGSDSVCHSVTITATGIKDVDLASQISVYPNPANRILNVYISSALSNTAQIEIVNMLGETVISRPAKGNATEKFDLENLSQGVYFVKISSEGAKAVKKFVYAK